LPSFWGQWLVATLASGVSSNLTSWALYASHPFEFFLIGSAVGSAAGVWIARRSGWRRAWLLGTALGVLLDVAVFVVMSRVAPNSVVSFAEVA
jgi:hypothetical protein